MLISGFVKNFGRLSLGPAIMTTMISTAPRDSGGSVSVSHVARTGNGSHALMPMLLGLSITQHAPPVKSVFIEGDRGLANVRDFRYAILGAALMMTMMIAVLRGGGTGGSVRHEDTRAAGCPTIRAVILGVTGALATKNGDRAAGEMLMMMMVKNFLMVRLTRSFAAGLIRSSSASWAVRRAGLSVLCAHKAKPPIAPTAPELGGFAAKVARASPARGSRCPPAPVALSSAHWRSVRSASQRPRWRRGGRGRRRGGR